MGNVNDALKELYLALGGDASGLSDNHTVDDYIRDLKSVLGVAPEPFDVVYTCTEENGTQTFSRTPAEILEAYNAGRTVRLISSHENYYYSDQYNYDLVLTMTGVFTDANDPEYKQLSFSGGLGNGIDGDNFYNVIACIDAGTVPDLWLYVTWVG